MEDAPPRFSKLSLALGVLGAVLNLTDAIRTRGPRRATVLLALGVGLPAAGEVLATGPLGLLRHRTRPRVAGVPVAILLGWYCATNGSLSVAENALAQLPLKQPARERLLPFGAALVGVSLDLILDPAGLDSGLWEWHGDGAYAREVQGANGHRGVPLVNYAGWLLLVAGVVSLYGRLSGERRPAGRLPALLLLPYYLAAAAWAVRGRRFRYLLYSSPFPAALYAGLKDG
ncbi:MAG: carotenoid biosynthesis protein [Rubrobacter sp.]